MTKKQEPAAKEMIVLSDQKEIEAAYLSDLTIDKLARKVREQALKFDSDVTTKAGREKIGSVAYHVTRSKTAVLAVGKEKAEKKKAELDQINDRRKLVTEKFDAIRDEIRKPLNDWEEAEAEREATKERVLAALDPERADARCSPAQIKEVIAEIELIDCKVVGDHEPIAEAKKTKALKALRDNLAISEEREADLKELEQLRAEKREREAAEAKAKAAADREAKQTLDRTPAAREAAKEQLATGLERTAEAFAETPPTPTMETVPEPARPANLSGEDFVRAASRDEYLIWSNEKGAWWRPEKEGYTAEWRKAGVYDRDEALRICRTAGVRGQRRVPAELPICAADFVEICDGL